MASPPHFETIAASIDALREAAIEYQQRLTAVPALAPKLGGDGEVKKAAVVREILDEIGVTEVDEHRAEDPEAPCGYRPSLIARLAGEDPEHTLWVMAHLDVVDPGKKEEWESDPWTVRVDGDRVYGRGVEDNQQGLVGALLLARALQEAEVRPPWNLGLLFVADEETGSLFGIHHLLQNREVFREGDLIIVPDGGVPDGTMIEVAEKGIVWYEFTVTGKQCHGSTPDKGVNAHRAAARLAVELEKLYDLFPRASELYDPPTSTFEPTRRKKNVDSVNIIPGEDVFFMDCRVMPEYELDEVTAQVEKICRQVEERYTRDETYRCRIACQTIQRLDAAPPTPPDALVVQRLKEAIREVYHVEGRPMGIGGGTVAAYIRRKGFPVAVWSRLDETLHAPNEYCLLSNLLGDAKVFAHVLLSC